MGKRVPTCSSLAGGVQVGGTPGEGGEDTESAGTEASSEDGSAADGVVVGPPAKRGGGGTLSGLWGCFSEEHVGPQNCAPGHGAVCRFGVPAQRGRSGRVVVGACVSRRQCVMTSVCHI